MYITSGNPLSTTADVKVDPLFYISGVSFGFGTSEKTENIKIVIFTIVVVIILIIMFWCISGRSQNIILY